MSNQKLLETLCGYVADKGPRLCGRVVKVLPRDWLSFRRKPKKLKTCSAVPCCASRADPTKPGLGKAVSSISTTALLIRQAIAARIGHAKRQRVRPGWLVLSEQRRVYLDEGCKLEADATQLNSA